MYGYISTCIVFMPVDVFIIHISVHLPKFFVFFFFFFTSFIFSTSLNFSKPVTAKDTHVFTSNIKFFLFINKTTCSSRECNSLMAFRSNLALNISVPPPTDFNSVNVVHCNLFINFVFLLSLADYLFFRKHFRIYTIRPHEKYSLFLKVHLSARSITLTQNSHFRSLGKLWKPTYLVDIDSPWRIFIAINSSRAFFRANALSLWCSYWILSFLTSKDTSFFF